MYENRKNRKHNPYYEMVPGFAAYERVGYDLAEGLVKLFEFLNSCVTRRR